MNKEMFSDINKGKFETLNKISATFSTILFTVSGVGIVIWGQVIASTLTQTYDKDDKTACAATSILAHALNITMYYSFIVIAFWATMLFAGVNDSRDKRKIDLRFYMSVTLYIMLYLFLINTIVRDVGYINNMPVLPANLSDTAACHNLGVKDALFAWRY